jgi:hypothetical protein
MYGWLSGNPKFQIRRSWLELLCPLLRCRPVHACRQMRYDEFGAGCVVLQSRLFRDDGRTGGNFLWPLLNPMNFVSYSLKQTQKTKT